MPAEQANRTIQSLVSRRKPITMEDSTGLSDGATQTLWTGMLHPLLRLGQLVFALPHHAHVSFIVVAWPATLGLAVTRSGISPFFLCLWISRVHSDHPHHPCHAQNIRIDGPQYYRGRAISTKENKRSNKGKTRREQTTVKGTYSNTMYMNQHPKYSTVAYCISQLLDAVGGHVAIWGRHPSSAPCLIWPPIGGSGFLLLTFCPTDLSTAGSDPDGFGGLDD